MSGEIYDPAVTAGGDDELPETVCDLAPSASSGAFTLKLPDELLEAHGFEGSFLISFEPVIEHNALTGNDEISFIVRRVSEPSDLGLPQRGGEDDPEIRRRRNIMRMWASSDVAGVTFPREFATAVDVDTPKRSSLYNEARKGNLRADVESLAEGVLHIDFQPSAITWEIPDDGGMDAFHVDVGDDWPVTKSLVTNDVGPSMAYESLRLELPASFCWEEVLNLDGGEKAATRIATVDGQPAFVLDRNVHPNEEDQPHVRTIFQSETNYQRRVLFSQRWIYAFGWDEETEFELTPGPDRIVITPADSE